MSESLPQRMREAAKVLEEASTRTPDLPCRPGYWSWTPTQLRNTAINWEAEDNAATEHEALVEDLAKTLLETCHDILRIESRRPLFDDARDSARKLIASGWTNQVTS